jgi:hypothetical protein
MNSVNKNILVTIFTTMWIFLISFAVLPSDFFKDPIQKCNFQSIGGMVLLTLMIYIFDIATEIYFSSKKIHVPLKEYVTLCLLLVVFCGSFLCISISIELWSIVVVLVVSGSMGIVKWFTLFYLHEELEDLIDVKF